MDQYQKILDNCRALPKDTANYLEDDYIRNLCLTVLDKQLPGQVVTKALDHLASKHGGRLRTHADLKNLLAQYPNDRAGNTEASLDLWGYRYWNRIEQLRALVAFFETIKVTDQEALRQWATTSTFEKDFKGKVRGLSYAVYNWLVMRQGVPTIKPDLRVKRFLKKVTGRDFGDKQAVEVLTRVAKDMNIEAHKLDWRIWEAEGRGFEVVDVVYPTEIAQPWTTGIPLIADLIPESVADRDQLSRLLQTATHALLAEDAAVAGAYARAPADMAPTYQNESHGLAYPAFETTVAWTIFKSWVPLVAVGNEEPYPESKSKADLVVFRKHSASEWPNRRGWTPRWVFEAKWWLADSKKVRGALLDDVEKLAGWNERAAVCAGDVERFLLLLWFNALPEWPDDMHAVEDLCAEDPRLEPMFISAFPSHWIGAGSEGAFFATAVLRVTR